VLPRAVPVRGIEPDEGGSICERLGLLAGWLEAECRRLGVALELGHRATPADVEGADAVVLGPGSPPAELPFPVDDDPRAVTALTILGGNVQV
jgi:2,4-dienoyl-CoA reductase (NADPH2)